MNVTRRSHLIGRVLLRDLRLLIGGSGAFWLALMGFVRQRFALFGAMLVLMLGHAGAAHAQAYCFPAHWYGFDLVSAANGQSTISDKTCGCGSSSFYVDSGGGCNAAATTRTTSGANNGNSWSVHVRSDYFSSCSNITDVTVSGSCSLTAKSQWYSVVATCSDHNTTATITMDSSITPLAPCVIDYMADSSYFDTVYVRDVIKFNNPITITVAAPAYAEIGSSFPVAATAAVGNVTISSSGNCTGGGTSSATITMTGASSADCVVTYSSNSDATYAGYSLTSNTNNNYYEGAYDGIKLNFKAFNGLDMLMTCGLTCAKTAADSHSWLGAGSGVSPQDEQPRTYGMKDADNPNDTWLIQVADGTGADTTYTIKSSVNAKCLAKAGTYLSFASCNSGDSAQKWKIAPFNGSDPTDAPTGIELSLPAYPGLWANVSIGYLSYKFGMNVSADHDWTSAFFFGTKIPPDHYRFEFDRTAALTCQAMPVTIKACLLPAATDPTCASLYPFTVSLRPAATKGTWSGFTASPATAFVGSSSGITLFDATAEATTFSYSLASVPPTVAALECYDTSTSAAVNCTNAVTFLSCSSYFDAVEKTTPVSVKGTNLFTKLSGTTFDFDVVGPSAYTGNVTVDLIDAATMPLATWACPTAASSMGTVYFTAPSVTTNTNTTTLSVVDPVTGTRRKSFTARYDNISKKVRVRITDALGNCYHSTDYFSIRPASLALSVAAIDPGGVAAAGTAANPNGTLGTKTGMTITATAKNSASTTLTAYTGTPQLNSAKTIADWSGAAISALPNPSTSPPVAPANLRTLSWAAGSGFGAAVSGVATGTFYYNDFGTLTFPADTVIDSSYTSDSGDQTADCVSNSASNTLSGGKYGCLVGAASLTSPRFRPDHYEAMLQITPRCSGGANAFTYMGDPNLTVEISLKAANAERGQMTRMWSNWVATALPTVAVTADNGGVAIALDAANAFALPNAVAWKAQASGLDGGFYSAESAIAPASAAFARTFVRPSNAPLGPYESFKLTMTLTDAVDGGKISWLNGVAVGIPAAAISSPTYRFRYGMLKLDNAYGPELLPLFVTARTLFWNGGGWSLNTDDTGCTAVPASRVASGNYKGAVTSLNLGVLTSTAFAGGLASIRIPARAVGSVGSTDLAVNLGSTVGSNSCSAGMGATTAAATLDWLRGNWCGGSYDKDPAARANFGSAKSPFLYRREKY